MSKAEPSEVAVRPARPDDHAAYLALFPELGVEEVVPGPDEWWAHTGPDTLIFEHDGAVVAYAWAQVLAGDGYIRHVVVDPRWRGRGLGRRVMAAVADRLRAGGCTQWRLNVKPDNAAAIRLYERVGMRRAYRSAAVRLTFAAAEDLPQDDLSLTTCPIDPAEDPAIEAAYALPRGQLAQMRADERRVVLRLADPADPADVALGFACFAPHFPGAFPFRVARPALARPLLAGLRPHALPEHEDRLQLVIEDDDPLRAELVAVGARVALEFVHMRGPLPP